MKLKKQRLLIAVTSVMLLAGCSLFKKKCDCPSFGGHGHSQQHRGPGW